jgi:probable F420-dependent oxidoreductase
VTGGGVHVGLTFANGARAAEPAHATALARAAEAAGYESLWTVQHVVMPVDQASRYPYSESGVIPGGSAVPIPDPLIWMTWAAAHTTSIKLATGVFILPQQNVLVVAKQVATLDRLAGGRTIFGVGAGWLREEYDAVGADFDDRGPRFDEQIVALRRAWEPGPAGHDGVHVSFAPVHVEPKPAATVPIVVGGHSRAAARRAGRFGDGFCPLARHGTDLRELVVLARQAAVDAGRDPAALEITTEAPRTSEDRDMQRELGVARVLVNAPNVEVDALPDAVARRLERTRALLDA